MSDNVTMSPDSACCGNCRFWNSGTKVSTVSWAGQCRRVPPVIDGQSLSVMLSEYKEWRKLDDAHFVNGATLFPCTEESDWCGEHQWRR
jgi:hypothetical protein